MCCSRQHRPPGPGGYRDRCSAFGGGMLRWLHSGHVGTVTPTIVLDSKPHTPAPPSPIQTGVPSPWAPASPLPRLRVAAAAPSVERLGSRPRSCAPPNSQNTGIPASLESSHSWQRATAGSQPPRPAPLRHPKRVISRWTDPGTLPHLRNARFSGSFGLFLSTQNGSHRGERACARGSNGGHIRARWSRSCVQIGQNHDFRRFLTSF